MQVKVKLKGSGTPDDPYGANLPTYRHVYGSIDQGWIIVDVPDDVHGLSEDDLKSAEIERTTRGDVVTKLPAGALETVHRHLDKRYPSATPPHRVEFV